MRTPVSASPHLKQLSLLSVLRLLSNADGITPFCRRQKEYKNITDAEKVEIDLCKHNILNIKGFFLFFLVSRNYWVGARHAEKPWLVILKLHRVTNL